MQQSIILYCELTKFDVIDESSFLGELVLKEGKEDPVIAMEGTSATARTVHLKGRSSSPLPTRTVVPIVNRHITNDPVHSSPQVR